MTKEDSAKLLDKAAVICVTKHAGQRDKTGAAYFQHPMRVAMRCHTDEEKMVALLHDTIEDTDVTAEYLLAEGFPQSVVDGILSVTKVDGESYEDFVARAAQNPLGRVVKLHDLEDNLDIFRLDSVSPEMAALFTKYLAAHRFLLNDDVAREEMHSKEVDEGLTDNSSVNTDSATRVAISRSESHRNQRARINQRLKNFRSNGGTEYMQNKISVLMPDRKVIADYATYSSFIKVVEFIGFERVAALDMKYGQYPIVTKSPIGNVYSKANASWFVLSKWPTPVVAQYVNNIADALDLYIECDVVPK